MSMTDCVIRMYSLRETAWTFAQQAAVSDTIMGMQTRQGADKLLSANLWLGAPQSAKCLLSETSSCCFDCITILVWA